MKISALKMDCKSGLQNMGGLRSDWNPEHLPEFKKILYIQLGGFSKHFLFPKPQTQEGRALIEHKKKNHFLPQLLFKTNGASLVAQSVKNLSVVQETWVRSQGWEDPLEKEMVTHSSILAWKIPWTEEPGGLQSMVSQRVGHH